MCFENVTLATSWRKSVDTIRCTGHDPGMKIVLVILFCYAFGVPLVRFTAFYLCNRKYGQWDEICALLESRRRTSLFSAYASGVLSDVGVLLMLPLLPLMRRERRKPGTPVILVHGLYHNPSAWAWFRVLLARAGYHNIHYYGYNSFTRGFDHAVEGLTRFIDSVLEENDGEKVVLVGHSLGGLVARKAAAEERFADRIAALATLGSPHQGSRLAILGLGPMARSLYPGRHIQQVLHDTKDISAPRLAVYTLTDDYVMPMSCLRVERPGWEEQICGPISHVSMLFSQDVSWRVVEFLDRNIKDRS